MLEEDKDKKKATPPDRTNLERENGQLTVRVNQLLTLLNAGRSIASTLDPNDVLTRIVDAAITITKAEKGALMLLDSRSNELYVVAQKGLGEKFAQTIRLKVIDSLAGQVLTTRKPTTQSHLKIKTGYLPKSIIYVPVVDKNETLGVLSVSNEITDRDFGKADENLLCGLADFAAPAIRNTNLIVQEKTLRNTFEAISSHLTLGEVSDKILDETCRIIEYKKASLQLIQGDTRTLLAGRGFEKKTDTVFHRKISEDYLIGRIMAKKVPIVLSRTEEDRDWQHRPGTDDVKSWAGVPLVYSEEVVGLLTLDHDQPGFYNESKIKDLLASFAHQAAIDLRKAYLFEIAEERIKNLEIINNVVRIMTTQLGTKDLLETIANEVFKQLQCTHCTIFFPQEESGELVLAPQVAKGNEREQIMSRRFKVGEGVAGWVFQHGKPLTLSDATTDTRFAPARKNPNAPRSMLVVPIRSGDQTIGIISADQDVEGWFNENQQHLVEALALQAGIAIERNVGFDLLQKISTRIVSLQDMDLILHEIVEGAIKLTHTTTGVIFLLAEDGLAVEKTFYPPGFDHPSPRLNDPNGLTRYVIATGEVLPILDIHDDQRVNPVLRDEFHSMIAVPLKLEQKVIGVLYLNDKIRHDFTEAEISMLLTLGSQAAIAIEKARLLGERKQRLDELTALHNTSLDIVRQLDLERILRDIICRAVELLDAERGGILLAYPSEKEVRMAFTHNLDQMRDFSCKFGEGMAGSVAESGQPLIVDDYPSWQYRNPALDEEPFQHLLRAVAQVPLNWKKETVGILLVSDSRPDKKFNDKDRSLLERFANLAALAIGNAREHSYIQSLVSVSPDAITAIDRKGHVTQFNDASERVLGYSKDEVIGQYVAQYYWDGEEEARKVNHALIEKGDAGLKGYETYLKGKNGEKIPIRLAGMILRDEMGRQIGSFGVLTDLRERTELLRKQRQSEFLASLEHFPQDEPILDISDLRQRLKRQLDMASQFCQSEYLVLFASIEENETVLPAIACCGLPPNIEDNLPHFNWRKAGLQPEHKSGDEVLKYEADLIASWAPDQDQSDKVFNGIRGNRQEFFANASYWVPLRLADNYRSLLVFGPFTGEIDVGNADFLKSVNLTISTSALSWLQTLYLRTRQKRAETSTGLITHRTLMNLMQVDGKFGSIKHLAGEQSPIYLEAVEGERIIQQLSGFIGRAFRSGVIDMEAEDYSFQPYSLATLVQNCVEGFKDKVSIEGKELRIDASVENLPYAEIDPVMLSIALSNLVDNARKYSFGKTFIAVKAEYDTQKARITITDVGGQMPEEAKVNLNEPGQRWVVSAGARRIPGMGLGLWEASIIVNVHGGEVNFSSTLSLKYGKDAHLVSVWMELPLKRKRTGKLVE